MTVRSQNGWIANNVTLTKVWAIPGTGREIRLHRGDAGWLLVDFAAKFDKAVESIDEGQLDDWGYAERNVRGSDDVVSNHASGTAIDLNALKHPLGARGTFTKVQTANIRALLDQYEGVIRWGGDYVNRADEMHFEINASPTRVSEVAARIRNQQKEFVMQAGDAQEIENIVHRKVWATKAVDNPATPGSADFGLGGALHHIMAEQDALRQKIEDLTTLVENMSSGA